VRAWRGGSRRERRRDERSRCARKGVELTHGPARSVRKKGWGRASAARAGCRWRVGPAGRAGDARGVRARDAAAEGDARAALRGTSAGRRWQVGPGVTGRG